MIHSILRDRKIILASESPRRKQILELVGLTPLVVPSMVEEPSLTGLPYKQAISHSLNKLHAVRPLFSEDSLVIAADTIVYINDQVLGKPVNAFQIREHLQLLSSNTHSVYTGVSISFRNNIISDYQRTKVRFKELTSSEIEEYIKTGEPKDKAGSYGIQGYGAQFIEAINGCYFNVMGFPVQLFYEMISRFSNV